MILYPHWLAPPDTSSLYHMSELHCLLHIQRTHTRPRTHKHNVKLIPSLYLLRAGGPPSLGGCGKVTGRLSIIKTSSSEMTQSVVIDFHHSAHKGLVQEMY